MVPAIYVFILFALLAFAEAQSTSPAIELEEQPLVEEPVMDDISEQDAAAMPFRGRVDEDRASSNFATFMARNRKVYKRDSLAKRYRVFKSNLEFSVEYNSKILPNSSFQLNAVDNPLADETFEEFKKRLGLRPRTLRESLWRPERLLRANFGDLPTEVDWRQRGAVTPIRDQGSCGSCYTFASAHAIEGAMAVAGRPLVSLSPKHLLDCTSNYGNSKCNGGLMDNCYRFVQKKGICSEKSYPYSPKAGTCRTCTPVTKIRKFTTVDKNEGALLDAIVLQPVSIAIAASSRAIQLYKSGIFDQADSCGTNLDHAVTLVGYGEENGTKYWIVKNSWGTLWGEQGYIRMKIGENMCGLKDLASYPVV